MHFLDPVLAALDPKTIVAAGYFVIAAIIFAECGLLVGFFLPGDSLLFTAGFLASQHQVGVDISTLSSVCALAAALGPLVGYWYGKALGQRLFNRDDSLFFRRRNLERAHEFYERHGARALILARFMPVVRTFAPVVAGMAAMNYRRFVVYTVVGALLWAVGVTWAGFFLGSLIPDASKYLELIVALIVVASIAPPIIHLLRERYRARPTLTRV
ncbi:MAG TPA: VTT domain-containing protein [Chloroflexota bacterium]|nr:VTT domain-containing protein [Chloroflexota bacterium]